MAHEVKLYRNSVQHNDLDAPTIENPNYGKYGGKRGKIRGFARASKLRLHRLLERVNRSDAPLFVTLTYQDYPDKWEESKKHLDRFKRSLLRIDPESVGIWRLEYQARGAPHYHLVLWGSCEESRAALGDAGRLSRAWCSASVQSSRAARKYSCKVETARNREAVWRYLLAHHLKEDQVRDEVHSGRYWGFVGDRSRLDSEPYQVARLSDSGYRLFCRLLAKYKRNAGRRTASTRTCGRIAGGGLAEIFVPYHIGARILRYVEGVQPDDPF